MTDDDPDTLTASHRQLLAVIVDGPTVGHVEPIRIADTAADHARVEAAVDELASRRPATVERLTTAAHRLIDAEIGTFRERLGDARVTATPPLDVAYIDGGKASIAIVVTFSVAGMNAEAADRTSTVGLLDKFTVMGALNRPLWIERDTLAVLCPGVDVDGALAELFDRGLVERVGSQWRRK